MIKLSNIFIILLLFTSCVITRPANNINKAENRIIKLNKGIKNQIDRYPSLVDKGFKVIVKDTIKVKGDTSEFDINIVNADSLEKVNKNYLSKLDSSNRIIDSLINVPLKDYPKECQYIVDQLQSRINRLGKEIKLQQDLSKQWFDKYKNEVNKSFTGKYEDSTFIVNYSYYNGKMKVIPSTKDKYVVVNREEYNYNVKIRKNFWQDIKFYPFLIVLVSIFYFFGNQVFAVTKIIIKKLLSLVLPI